jgi:spermidine synthase
MTFDFIFHDSDHGDGMIPEMVELFNKAMNPGGTKVINDDELLTKYAKRVRLGDRRAANSASVIALAQHQTGEPLASANASTKPPGVRARKTMAG